MLAERVRNPKPTGLPCSIGRLLSEGVLPPSEAEALRIMLGDEQNRGWTATEIWQALKDEGYEVGKQTINRHRGKNCRCW